MRDGSGHGSRLERQKARLCVLGFQDPDLTEVPRDSPSLSAASEALIMQWVASNKVSPDLRRHQDCILEWR